MNSITGRSCASRSVSCVPQVLASTAPTAAPAARRPHDLSNPAARFPLDLSHLARRAAAGLVAAAAVAVLAAPPLAPPPALANTENYTIDVRPAEDEEESEYFQTAPAELSSADEGNKRALSSYLAGPKRKEVEDCTRKCIPTCLRGSGEGMPGLGPISMRKEIVVFKEGYRSRNYCLRECVEVCSLTVNPVKVPGPATP